MFNLVTRDDLGGIVKFPLIKPDISVGRLHENDIVLPDPEVSRHHMEIKLRNNRVWVRDLDSGNGVFVNNERIHGVRWINPNDEIIIGSNQFKLEESEDQDLGSATLTISLEEAKQIYESTQSIQQLTNDEESDVQTMQLSKRDVMSKLYNKKIGVLAFPTVELLEGAIVTRRYLVPEGEFSIGRNENNNIRITDPAVSGVHATIVRVGGRYQLFDKESKNGTRVNGEPVKSVFLRHDDAIEIGGAHLQFKLPKQVKAPTDKPIERPKAAEPTVQSAPARPTPVYEPAIKAQVPIYLYVVLTGLGIAFLIILFVILFS